MTFHRPTTQAAGRRSYPLSRYCVCRELTFVQLAMQPVLAEEPDVSATLHDAARRGRRESDPHRQASTNDGQSRCTSDQPALLSGGDSRARSIAALPQTPREKREVNASYRPLAHIE